MMKPMPVVATGLVLSALGSVLPAQASDLGLSFELPPPPTDGQTEHSESDLAEEPVLPVPVREVPSHAPVADLPPAPPAIASVPAVQPVSALPQPSAALALAFDLPGVAQPAIPASSPSKSQTLATASVENLFVGGSESLVARAVGSAEGTRTPKGDRTRAYYGHKDPGNGVWNLGSFSYQHGADSPEQADEKQLKRLQQQTAQLIAQANALGLSLSLEETLNGIDLANQSPRAALERGGYAERLKQARDMGFSGTDAILWARVRSYLDPDTQQWNAPGLGNTLDSISHDQERRMRQVLEAIAAQSYGHVAERPHSSSAPAQPDENSLVERIIGFDLS